MTKSTPLIIDMDQSLAVRTSPVVQLSKIAAPFTTVLNRALVTDFSADALPKFGIDRVMTQAIEEVQGETGPSGQRVFKPIGDVHDAVRFVGSPVTSLGSAGSAIALFINSLDFVEITFYGTGLNILSSPDGSNRSGAVVVDGVSLGTLVFSTTSSSSVLHGRNYAAGVVIPVVSGLTLGLHTVKITASVSNPSIQGYEVLNTSATLQYPKAISYIGSKRLAKNSVSTDAYNSGFESGTLGTRGGHVLVYQKSDGTIAKAVTPTNASAAYLTSADHANEEVLRVYHWREFGAGRADDFSSLTTSTSSRAFTIDDGTTTLAGSSVIGFTGETLFPNTTNSFITFTFVGTGLDIMRVDGAASALDAHTITVDGSSAGTISGTGSTTTRIQKICSGLPYGTHTVKINRDASAGQAVGLTQLIVYGPTKPILPAGCVSLSDYFVMADYVITATGQGSSLEVSQGVLRKAQTREHIYNGTWAAAAVNAGQLNGFSISTSTTSNYVELTFVGTGINLRGSYTSTTPIVTVNVDGIAYTGAATANGGVWTAGTSQWSITGAFGSLLSISGLTFGLHTIRITKTATGADYIHVGADIITPIHTPKLNAPGIQNTLSVGSCAIGDLRNLPNETGEDIPNWAQAVGIASSPTTNVTTLVPLADMSVTIKTNGNPVEVSYHSVIANSSVGAVTALLIVIEGVNYLVSASEITQATADYRYVVASKIIIPMAAGVHKIDVYWNVSAGTGTARSTYRTLVAREL